MNFILQSLLLKFLLLTLPTSSYSSSSSFSSPLRVPLPAHLITPLPPSGSQHPSSHLLQFLFLQRLLSSDVIRQTSSSSSSSSSSSYSSSSLPLIVTSFSYRRHRTNCHQSSVSRSSWRVCLGSVTLPHSSPSLSLSGGGGGGGGVSTSSVGGCVHRDTPSSRIVISYWIWWTFLRPRPEKERTQPAINYTRAQCPLSQPMSIVPSRRSLTHSLLGLGNRQPPLTRSSLCADARGSSSSSPNPRTAARTQVYGSLPYHTNMARTRFVDDSQVHSYTARTCIVYNTQVSSHLRRT